MSKRFKIVIIALAATTLISFSMLEQPNLVLLWSVSASAPVGLYFVRSVDKLEVVKLVVARPASPLADILAEGGYLPRGVCPSSSARSRSPDKRSAVPASMSQSMKTNIGPARELR